MQITKFKRVLAGFLSIAMVLSSGTFNFVNAHAEEETTVAQSSSISISIPDGGSDTADAGSAVHINVKASAPAGGQDTTFVFVTDADVTVEKEIEEVELSQKDRVFSFTLDNSEADAETEFTIGLVSENAGTVSVRTGYGIDMDTAVKAAEEVEDADLTLIWTAPDTTPEDSSTTSTAPETVLSNDEEKINKSLARNASLDIINTDNTTIEQFSATLKSGATLQEDGSYYLKPENNYTDNTLVTYSVNYAISGSEDHAAGAVTIRIPAHLFKDRTSTADNTVWADKCTLSVPEAPKTSANGTFNYTYDESTDEYVLTNYNTLAAASEGVFEFSYVINNPANIVDMSVSREFVSDIKIDDSKGMASATSKVAPVTVDTQVVLDNASKGYVKMYEVWQNGWGEKPSDSTDYFYVIWRVGAHIAKGVTQNYTVKVLSDTLSDDGSVVGYWYYGGPYSLGEAEERALTASYTVDANSKDIKLNTYSDAAVWQVFYVLTKHPRIEIPESGIVNIKNTATVSVRGIDDAADQQKTASASYQYIDTGFKYIGDGEISLTKKTRSSNSYNTSSALTMLEKGLNVDIRGINSYPPFQNISSVQGYAHTLKDGGDASKIEDYGQNPLKIELIDDTLFLGDDFTTKLHQDDYEISRVVLNNVSISELQTAGDSYFENELDMDVDHEGWMDISLYGQFGDNNWVYLGKWIYNHESYTCIYYVSEEDLQNTDWYPEGSYTIVGGPVTAYEVYKNSGEYTEKELEEKFPTDEEKSALWYQISEPYDHGWGYNYFEPADITKDYVIDSNSSDYWYTYIYDNPDNYLTSLPSGLTAVKASYETTAYRSDIELGVSVKIKPSEHVLSIIDGKESVQLRNINTLEVYNSKGDYILDTVTEYVGDGAKYVEQQDQELYGRDAFHKTSTLELKGASYSGSAYKSTVYTNGITNDAENQRVVLNYYFYAYENMNHARTTSEEIVNAGLLIPQDTGTFYDLLPKGVEVDTDSILVSPYWGYSYSLTGNPTGYESYCTHTTEIISNYNGTGRTMLIIHVAMSGDNQNYRSSEYAYDYTQSGYQVTFKAYYSWDNLADYGNKLLNSMAYETGNDSITKGYPDNGGNLTEASLMSDLNKDGNPEGTANTFLYDDVTTTLNVNTSAELSLSKLVKAEGGFTWSNGQDDSVVVPGGGNYSYRLRFGSAAGTTTSNMILFDSLENYTPEGVDEQWHGILKSIDTSQVEARGINPVIYYSTVSNLTFDNEDQTGTTDPNRDLTNTNIWSTTAPDDLSKVTAIAIDMRKNADGTDASLSENTTLSVIVHMQAPTDNLRHLVSEKVGAYNNIYLQDTLTTKAGTITDQFVNHSYTKVLLEEVPVEIHKSSDPETGMKEDPAEVVYQGSLNYDVSVKNISKNLRLTSLQVQDTIPDGLTIGYDDIKYYYDDNSSDAKPVAGSDEVTLSYEGQSLVFDIQKLDAGSTIHFIIPTTVSKEAGTYVNTAHLTKVNGMDYELDSETTYHFDDYGRLDIKKVDEMSDEAIEGIKFSLYRASVDDDGNWTKVDSVAAGTITTDQNGLGSFTKILPGTYLLYEDSLKIGYYPVKEPWHVTVTTQDTTVVTADGSAVKSVSDKDNDTDITRYIITNKKIEILPSTGSRTALLFTLIGLCGIAGYGIYETLKRRKRNKQ